MKKRYLKVFFTTESYYIVSFLIICLFAFIQNKFCSTIYQSIFQVIDIYFIHIFPSFISD